MCLTKTSVSSLFYFDFLTGFRLAIFATVKIISFDAVTTIISKRLLFMQNQRTEEECKRIVPNCPFWNENVLLCSRLPFQCASSQEMYKRPDNTKKQKCSTITSLKPLKAYHAPFHQCRSAGLFKKISTKMLEDPLIRALKCRIVSYHVLKHHCVSTLAINHRH